MKLVLGATLYWSLARFPSTHTDVIDLSTKTFFNTGTTAALTVGYCDCALIQDFSPYLY